MKKLIAMFVLAIAMTTLSVPAFAEDHAEVAVKNLKSGADDLGKGFRDTPDVVHEELAKAHGMPDEAFRLANAGVISGRRTIHHIGAGVIELLTFWIPKKQPLVTENRVNTDIK